MRVPQFDGWNKFFFIFYVPAILTKILWILSMVDSGNENWLDIIDDLWRDQAGLVGKSTVSVEWFCAPSRSSFNSDKNASP